MSLWKKTKSWARSASAAAKSGGLWKWLAILAGGALAVLVAVLGAFGRGRSQGKIEEQNRQGAANRNALADAVERKEALDAEVEEIDRRVAAQAEAAKAKHEEIEHVFDSLKKDPDRLRRIKEQNDRDEEELRKRGLIK